MVEYTSTVWLVPMLVTLAILYLGTAYWVYRDARRRGSDRAVAWGIGMLVLGPANLVGFGFYLLARRNFDGPSAPPTRIDRLVRNVVVAALLTFVVVATVGPPDPLTQAYRAAVALPVLVGLAVLYTYRDVLTPAA